MRGRRASRNKLITITTNYSGDLFVGWRACARCAAGFNLRARPAPSPADVGRGPRAGTLFVGRRTARSAGPGSGAARSLGVALEIESMSSAEIRFARLSSGDGPAGWPSGWIAGRCKLVSGRIWSFSSRAVACPARRDLPSDFIAAHRPADKRALRFTTPDETFRTWPAGE